MVAIALALFCFPSLWAGDLPQKPKVRAITAFIRIDRDHYAQPIAEALAVLRQAKASFEKGGYEVQTIRITTQPFPQYTRGMKSPEALQLFKALEALSAKEGFSLNIGHAVRSLPVKRVGYSGLILSTLEDPVLAQRWSEGAYTLDSLLAYSAVCGTGLDTVPLPGDTSQEQLERIISDVASLAVKWNKPLTARLILAPGKKAGERTEFTSPHLTNTVLRPL